MLDGIGNQFRQPPLDPVPTRPDLGRIEQTYQVPDDKVIDWEPSWVGWFVDSVRITATEGELLDNLQTQKGLIGLDGFKGIKEEAFSVSEDRYQGAGAEDGHQDAFRHAYWNARMSQEYGNEFAQAFGTAHEGLPGNPSDREAMDLYNNEVGRQIASENPDASAEQMADLIQTAIEDGKMLVIDQRGDLAWSDQVQPGQTGEADGAPIGGALPKADGDTYPSGST